MNIDQQATDRVMKARAEVILTRRFYGVLVSNVEPVLSRQFPTMATNGKQHFFNPKFVMGLNKNHLGRSVSPEALIKGVQCHETEHDARHHGTRRGTRDPKKWNEACDYAINIDLIREGFELPEGALIDPRFDGMSAEDIYRIRELDEQRNKPQPPPPPEDEDEESEPESDEGNGDDEQEPEDDESDDEQQGDEPSDDDDADDEGDSESDGDEQSEDEDGEGAGGDDDDSSDEGDDDPEGDGASSDDEGDDESSESSSGEGDADGEGESESTQQSSGDPGMCGEVLDSAQDATTKAEEDIKWERVVREAVSIAKAAGQLPGHISRDIERANNPGQDWREVLRAWFTQGALRIETWNKPNRRFVGRGLYLPGNQRDGVNRVAFLIDTSGSMDTIALACIKKETQNALDDGVIDEIIVIYGDTQVNRVDTYKTGDEIEFDPRGGGGTRLRPLFEHVETLDDVSLIVCFTDMENSDWGNEPSVPVLFAATGYPDRVREYLANAPWNAPGIDVGEH